MLIYIYFYVDNAEVLKSIQKNLNDGKPHVLLCRFDDSNSLSIDTVPQIEMSNGVNCREVSILLSDISKNNAEFDPLTNMDLFYKNRFDNNENINKSQRDSCILENLENNQHVKEQNVCSSKDHTTELKVTPSKSSQANCSNECANESLGSLSPVVDDILHASSNMNIENINIKELCSNSLFEKDNDYNELLKG